jgi:hypothetical protein
MNDLNLNDHGDEIWGGNRSLAFSLSQIGLTRYEKDLPTHARHYEMFETECEDDEQYIMRHCNDTIVTENEKATQAKFIIHEDDMNDDNNLKEQLLPDSSQTLTRKAVRFDTDDEKTS